MGRVDGPRRWQQTDFATLMDRAKRFEEHYSHFLSISSDWFIRDLQVDQVPRFRDLAIFMVTTTEWFTAAHAREVIMIDHALAANLASYASVKVVDNIRQNTFIPYIRISW